jgi:hypothetical protein
MPLCREQAQFYPFLPNRKNTNVVQEQATKKERLKILERQQQEAGKYSVMEHAESLKLGNGNRILFLDPEGCGRFQKPRHTHR